MAGEDLLDELHDVRERLLAEAGGTLKGLVERLKEHEAQQRERVIPVPPKAKSKRRDDVA